MPPVAILILNYNGAHLLRQFLPDVIRHSHPARIVVVDNASTDASRELLRDEFREVERIELEKNFGYAGGYNRAIQWVDTPYVVLLNSDVEVTPGWLNPLIELLESRPDVAAVQPKILSYANRSSFEYAGAGGGFIDALGYPFCRGRLFDDLETDKGQYDDLREVFWASGACMVIRTSVYKELGGLYEDFFAHMEEIDLCWRIIRSGRKVYYCGQSAVYHVGAGTLAYGHPKKLYLNFRNNLCLLAYHVPPAQLFPKLGLRLVLDWIAMVRFICIGQFQAARSIIRAHVDFLKNWKNIVKHRNSLSEILPFSMRMVYPRSVVWQYFILGKKKIDIPSAAD